MAANSNVVRVLDTTSGEGRSLPLVVGAGSARVVLWPENGALYRTLHIINLKGGDKSIDLRHRSDAVFYVIEGRGDVVEIASGDRKPVVEGSMVHVDRGDAYRFETGNGAGMTLIGGPCPADEDMYVSLAKEKN